MLQHLRERLTLLLIALLPLHALLVTVGTKLIEGPGHAPMTALAAWKEVLLGIILITALVEISLVLGKASSLRGGNRVMVSPVEPSRLPQRVDPSSFDKLRMTWLRVTRCDGIDLLILVLILLSIVVTYFTHQDWKLTALGFKYDFLPLTAFLILRRVAWSGDFLHSASTVLLGIGAAVAAYGLATLVLPREFFLWLGYGDAHSLYFPDQPLASFQLIAETGIRRMQSTFSGPNQFGLWLLIPLSVVLANTANCRAGISLPYGSWHSLMWFGMLGLLMSALFFSFSRSAWISAAVMVLVTLHAALPRKIFWRSFAALALVGVVVASAGIALSPKVLGRLSSSRGHLTRPLEAVQTIMAHPFGLGLGTAGPASNRVSETCVMLRPQDDPEWAKSQPTLCVFLGDTQVQPADHVCRCPLHPENWYLQVGVEMGVLGLVLFIVLIAVVLRRLGMQNAKCKMQNDIHSHFSFRISHFVFLSFLAISVAALFLHAWEDGAVAYTLWILTASSSS